MRYNEPRSALLAFIAQFVWLSARQVLRANLIVPTPPCAQSAISGGRFPAALFFLLSESLSGVGSVVEWRHRAMAHWLGNVFHCTCVCFLVLASTYDFSCSRTLTARNFISPFSEGQGPLCVQAFHALANTTADVA